MGKDLKGKELGVGISQRKDGLYTARFVSQRTGKNVQKYFPKLQDCRNWYADARFQDEHSDINASSDMTVDSWFEYWIENIKEGSVRKGTLNNYKIRYNQNIKDCIGKMIISEVKPMHCQNVLNQMKKKYKSSTIGQTRMTMSLFFYSALENEIINKNPVTRAVKAKIGKESIPKKALTIDEQKYFLNCCRGTINYNQYAFVLQTGLRVGELIGLKWSDVDIEKNVIHIRRGMEFDYKIYKWIEKDTKSKTSVRDIPLTKEALEILENQKQKNNNLKVININYKDYIFLNRDGKISKGASYNQSLKYICKKNNIKVFSMHILRHTFATRCIEAGMRPKTLQILLGHSDVGITMNLYVHVTEDEKAKEIEKIENALKIV